LVNKKRPTSREAAVMIFNTLLSSLRTYGSVGISTS